MRHRWACLLFSLIPILSFAQSPITVAAHLFAPDGIGSSGSYVQFKLDNYGTQTKVSQFPFIDVRAYGAVGDAQFLHGCGITAGTTLLTCPKRNGFTPASVGKTIVLPGVGAPNGSYAEPLITTIASYVSVATVNLATVALQTVSGNGFGAFGTDNAAAFCAAAQCTQAVYTGIFVNGSLTGRTLYFPGGAYLTTEPVYCRNNMGCMGAPQAGTQILLANSHDIPTEMTVNFGTANITPVVCMGNATAGTGTCTADIPPATGSLSAYDLLAYSIGSRTVGFLATNVGQAPGSNTSGVYFHNLWPETYYGVVGWNTTFTSIDGLENDTGTHIGIVAVGDGNPAHNNSWQITNSQLGLAHWGVWLDGASDVLISGNNSSGTTNSDIVFYSSSGHNSNRVTIAANDFTATPGFAGVYHIRFEGPCINCAVVGNVFANAKSYDVALDSAASGTTNLLVGHNHFYRSGSVSFAAGAVTSGSWIGEGNVWDTPGQYAVFSGEMNVKFDNNTCINPFAVTGPNGRGVNPFENGCFFFTGSTANTVEASNNSVISSGGTKYPAVNVYGASAVITSVTTGNRSDYSGCAVCDFSARIGIATSFNEVATNYGTSGTTLFAPFFSNGGLQDSGTTFLNLGTPKAGTIRYCSDCTVLNVSLCSTASIANCVCTGSGSGAIAKRLNGSWYCN